jgi:hypothetical protein
MLVMLKCDSLKKKLDTHALLRRELSFNGLFLYCFDLFYLNCMVVLIILIVLFCFALWVVDESRSRSWPW